MNPETEFKNLLRQHRFKLVADKNHYKYLDPAGRILVVSKTPSDFRAYHNMVRDLKHTVANPPPSNHVIEYERRRKALEEYIRLHPAVKKTGGISGAAGKGKGANSRGTGFIYDDTTPAAFVPDEVKEQQRNDKRMDGLIRRVTRQRVEAVRAMKLIYDVAEATALLSHGREQLAIFLRDWRKNKDAAQHWSIGMYQQGRKNEVISKFANSLSTFGRVKQPAETVFDAIQYLGEVEPEEWVAENAEIEYYEEPVNEAFVGWVVEESIFLSVQLWEASDFLKPGWMTPNEFSPMPNRHRRGLQTLVTMYAPSNESGKRCLSAINRLISVAPRAKRGTKEKENAELEMQFAGM
jgi:hypothetical protein